MRPQAWWLLLVLAACPERKHPERGVLLVYSKDKPVTLRDTVERRLARAQLPVKLSEDDQQLSVRVPEGTDVFEVKSLLGTRGRFELCEELDDDEKAWCGLPRVDGVLFERVEATGGCVPTGSDEQALVKLVSQKASGRVLVGNPVNADGLFVITAFAAAKSCFTPRVLAGELKPDAIAPGQHTALLTLDDDGAKQLAELTRKSLKQRLLFVIDERVLLAPVVMQPITGGKLMITLARPDQRDAQRLLDAIIGGPLEGLSLSKEQSFGPPRLGR